MNRNSIVSWALIAALSISIAGCGSTAANTAPPAATAADTGGCQIDAAKICQATGPKADTGSAMTMPPAVSYGPAPGTLPQTVQFDIPAGPSLQVMCYYDPQHGGVSHADLANAPPMTPATVKYLRDQHFCANQ